MIKILTEYGNKPLIDIFDRCLESALKVVGEFKSSADLYIDLAFLTPEEIKEINAEYRGIDKVTDVLSFPSLAAAPYTKESYPYDYDEAYHALYFGQIFLCIDKAKEQAEEYGNTLYHEAAYLFAHSVLHLCGYDHQNEADEKQMHTLCGKIIDKIC